MQPSVVMCIAYARRIDSMEAKVMHEVNEAMEFVGSLNVPGAYLAETFPFLRHLPTWLAPWKKVVAQRSKQDADLFGNLALEVKECQQMGKPVPDCFVKSLIDVSACLIGLTAYVYAGAHVQRVCMGYAGYFWGWQ
jgi:hypothetical protein